MFLAEKFLTEREYELWAEEKRLAQLETVNRDEKVEAIDSKIEYGLELVGSTAIEDRLQDEVADTI